MSGLIPGSLAMAIFRLTSWHLCLFVSIVNKLTPVLHFPSRLQDSTGCSSSQLYFTLFSRCLIDISYSHSGLPPQSQSTHYLSSFSCFLTAYEIAADTIFEDSSCLVFSLSVGSLSASVALLAYYLSLSTHTLLIVWSIIQGVK